MAVMADVNYEELWKKERAMRMAYEGSITWDTTCLNCSGLMDKNYEQYCKIDEIKAALEAFAGRHSAILAETARDPRDTQFAEHWVEFCQLVMKGNE